MARGRMESAASARQGREEAAGTCGSSRLAPRAHDLRSPASRKTSSNLLPAARHAHRGERDQAGSACGATVEERLRSIQDDNTLKLEQYARHGWMKNFSRRSKSVSGSRSGW